MLFVISSVTGVHVYMHQAIVVQVCDGVYNKEVQQLCMQVCQEVGIVQAQEAVFTASCAGASGGGETECQMH